MVELVAVDLQDVRDRLCELDLFTNVSDVADMAEAMETAVRPPAAFVAVAAENATANRTQGVHDQAVEVTLAVLFVVAASRRDGRRVDEVEQLRLGIIGQLAGYTPAGASKALDFASYRIIRLGGGHVWAECSFRTGWRLRVQAG
jgi:hypothetical protein